MPDCIKKRKFVRRVNMYNKLEKKFGKFALPGLMKYVVGLYLCGFVIFAISSARDSNIYWDYLAFDIPMILKGQVWRIVTWLLQPIDSSLFFMLISVYFYYMIGSTLERFWGTFRFNLFYFSGILFNILAAVLFYLISGPLFGVNITYPISLEYINLSMFFAFSSLFSDTYILLFFILPIKIKYVAYIYAAVELYGIVQLFVEGNWRLGIAATVVCVVSLLNFFIYFFNAKKHGVGKLKQARRQRQFERAYNQGAAENRATMSASRPITRHKCAVCGRTELDGDDLEFRFCSKCDGNYEYCMDHLYTHTHVVRQIIDPNENSKN